MNLSQIGPGKEMPNDFNVIIEIPAHGAPIKFEYDKAGDVIMVDRFLGTSMLYPANYGFVPQTLADDGDPVDVLVITPFPLPPGCLIRCRALGMLRMEDESGIDAKLIAVPVPKLSHMYDEVKSLDDLPQLLRDQIIHFFEHYKDLEPGKWVKLHGWAGIEEATDELTSGIANFNE